MAPTRKLGELFYELGVRTEGLKKDLDQSERAFGKLTTFVLKNPVIALGALSSAAVGVAIRATQMAAQIDASMRKVASSVPTGAAGLETLRKELERISIATGKTQEELAQASEEIARLGAGSAQEVAQRLRAATEASQASGTDLQTIITGLDQTLDLFGLSSADAARALAELFSVTKGRASLEDVFQALEKAAPSIQKLGLDLPTASRALIQLTESGLSTEKAAIALKKLADGGEAGRKEVEKLAATIPKAVDPMADLATAAQRVNDSATNAGPRIRAELSATLQKLGDRILPGVLEQFAALLRVIERFQGGTTEELQQAFTTIVALGRSVLPVLATNDWNEASEKIRTVQRAILQLSDASLDGRVDLQQFGVQGLGVLANQIAKFSTQSRLFSPDQQKQLQTFLEQIIKAQAELVRLQNTNIGKAAPAAPDVETDEARAARAARQQSEREAAARALRDMEQGFSDLFARVAGGNVSLEEFDRSVRELGDAFRDKLKTATAEQASLFATLEARAKGARETLASITAKKAALEFDALRASLTPSLVDDFRVAMRQLREELERQKLSPEQIADLEALKQAQIDVALGAEDLESRITNITARSISSFDAQLGLMDALRGAEEQLRLARTAPDALTDAGEIRIKSLVKQIDVLKEKIKELGGSSGAALDVENADGFADALSDASDFALGLSTVLLGADDTITRMIAGVSQVASGFAKVAELAGKAGGLSQLFGSGAGVAAALPAIGGVIGGLGAIFSAFGKDKADPLREKQLALLDQNNKRLQELRDGLESALRVSSGGATASTILSVAISGETVDGDRFALSAREFLVELSRLGIGLDDIRRVAKDLNIELSDNPTIEELGQLQDAIRQINLGKLFDGVEGLLQLNDLDKLFDPTRSPLASLQKDLEALGATGAKIFQSLAADIAAGDFDGARKRLQQFVKDLAANAVNLEDLGSIDPGDLVGIIQRVLAGLNDAAPKISSSFEKITTALANLSDELEVLDITDPSERAKRIVATVSGLVPAIAAAIGDVDLSTLDGAAAADNLIKQLFANRDTLSAVDRGGLSVEEFTQLLLQLDAALDATTGSLQQQIDARLEAERRVEEERLRGLDEAQRAAEDERAKRVRDAIQRAANESTFADDTTEERLRRLVAALGELSPAVNGLLDGLDLSTAEGIFTLNERLEALFLSLSDGADLGDVSLTELLQVLLELRNGSDDLAKALNSIVESAQSLAERLRAAFDDAEFDIALRGITDPLAQLTIKARAAASAIPEIAKALEGIDLSTASGRRQADTALVALGQQSTDPAVRSAILEILEKIRALQEDAGGAGAGADPLVTKNSALTVQSAASITEVTANRWLDVMTTDLALSRERNSMLMQILATVASAPVIRVPLLAGGGGAGGAVINQYHVEIPVIFNGPVSTADATEFSAELQRSIYAVITQQLAQQLQVSQRLSGKASA